MVGYGVVRGRTPRGHPHGPRSVAWTPAPCSTDCLCSNLVTGPTLDYRLAADSLGRFFPLDEPPVTIRSQVVPVLCQARRPYDSQPGNLRPHTQAKQEPPVAAGKVAAASLGETRLPAVARLQDQLRADQVAMRLAG